MDILEHEIYNSGNFDKTNISTEDILYHHTQFLNRYNQDSKPKLPFLYWTAKLHKDLILDVLSLPVKMLSPQPLSINIGYCRTISGEPVPAYI